MSLIDELGGYDEAKKFINGECVDGFDVQSLRSALLEYRRENNIFEVGDKVVHEWESSEIFEIKKHKDDHTVIHSNRSMIGISGGLHGCIRHATDKEIEQGHRDD